PQSPRNLGLSTHGFTAENLRTPTRPAISIYWHGGVSLSLLLLERSKVGDPLFELTANGPAEQYRFHFDMTKCIGCRCCEVACAEQNGNPLEINWRRVGEIEGGEYPYAERFYLSMGCNHCLDPACLTGCPTD